MANNLRQRLIKGIGANAIGQIVTVIIQLVSVPLFIQAWGVELYGEWLTLSTIPSYFAMSDIGFANVAANEMTMEMAKDNKPLALEIFQSTWLFISSVSLTIVIILLSVIWFIPIENWLNIKQQSHSEVICIIFLLTLHVLVGLQGGMLQAGFRCEGNYAVGAFINSIQRLFEYAVISVVAYMGGIPFIAALVLVIMRAIGVLYLWLELHKRSPWIVYGYNHARLDTIQRLINPAIAYMSFPAGRAINNQGIVTVIAVILGSTQVVIFSTLRTLSRLAFQFMNMINNTILPEISTAYGTGNLVLARKLHRYSCQYSLWLTFSAVAGLLVTGEAMFKVWTQGKLVIDTRVFHIMLLVIVANSLWLTSSIVLLATNNHQKTALHYITGTILSLLLAIWITPQLGLIGTALCVLLTDVIMSTYVVKTSLALLQDKFSGFAIAVVTPPLMKYVWKG